MGVFRFKQFSVCDDRAAMKVGTDAVLLGAWAGVDGASMALDAGTGCGVIAMMLAQRTEEHVRIDAIEIAAEDTVQAAENFSRSPWIRKIRLLRKRIQDFNPGIAYDLIVCNPPFFRQSLLPPRDERKVARHDLELTQEDLLDSSLRLLSERGRLSIILPPPEAESFIRTANEKEMFLCRRTHFFSRLEKKEERSLLEFQREEHRLEEDELVLYDHGQRWSEKYRSLTKDFYLDQPAS